MSKRFTDTCLWEKIWFRKLTPIEKCAWFYIKDRCDSVGVWEPDYEIAEIFIGGHLDWDAFREKCNGNIITFNGGKWFLVDFCSYQYGELNPECRPHQSYLKLLEKHGIKGYPKGIHTLKEKEKEKDKEKEQEQEKDAAKKAYGTLQNVWLTDKQKANLYAWYGPWTMDDYIERVSLWKPNAPRKVKDDYATILTWLRKSNVPRQTPENIAIMEGKE